MTNCNNTLLTPVEVAQELEGNSYMTRDLNIREMMMKDDLFADRGEGCEKD